MKRTIDSQTGGRNTGNPIAEALRIALLYLAVGTIWLFFFHRFFFFTVDPDKMHLWSIVKGLVFVLFTSLFLFYLVYKRAKKLSRYHTLERVRHLSQFEGLILKLAREFINVPVDGIFSKLEESLRGIGTYLDEDRMFFCEYDYNLKRSSQTLVWMNPRFPNPPRFHVMLPFDEIETMLQHHERGDVFYIEDMQAYNASPQTKKAIEIYKIRSFVSIPIMSGGKPIGYIGISSLTRIKSWKEDDLAILRIFAEMVRNVYERRNRELIIFNNNRNMRAILDSTSGGILLVARDGTILNINTAAATALNLTVHQATGGKILELLSGQQINRQLYGAFWKTIRSGTPNHLLWKLDGRYWIDTSFFPLLEPDDSVGAVAVFASNVTDRVNAETEIFKSRQMLREIIENAPVGIFWKDTQCKFIGWNKVMIETVGLTGEELAQGRGDSICSVSLDGQVTGNKKILDSGIPRLKHEVKVENAKGVTRILRESKVPLLDQDGKPYMLLGVFEDITEQKMMIQELENARQDAFAASKAKSDFLSMMSHEMRSPLNSVIGLAQIAMQTDNLIRIRDYLGKIGTSSRHLLGVINDILDISRIEAGKMTINRVMFDLEAVMEDTVTIMMPKAEEKRQNLNVYIGKDVPRHIVGDPVRVRQVLLNLLTNAIKFTSALGDITARVGLGGEENTIEFSVADNGIGIPETMLSRLFQPFEQIDMTISREYGGTGLGLAISQYIVERMGGHITVQSGEGVGSTFSFSVPVEAVPGEQLDEPGLPEGLRALVVVGEPETRGYLASMLEDISVQSDTAADGAEAVRLVHAAVASGFAYHVAFIDCRLSNIDHMDMAGGITRSSAGTRVVGIVPSDTDGTEERLREAGISCFLTGPIFRTKLKRVLAEAMHTGMPEPEQNLAKLPGFFAGKRILVAEDMEINQLIIREMLRESGAEILSAADGRQAVNAFIAEGGNVDAILMDVQMPVMDGYEATKAIRNSGLDKAGSVVIIAMTAHVFREDVEAALQAGMDGHIGKPVEYACLIHLLGRFL